MSIYGVKGYSGKVGRICLNRYTLPNDKILNLTKLNAFAEDKVNIAQITISCLLQGRKIVGKGEHSGYQHFLLFPQ